MDAACFLVAYVLNQIAYGFLPFAAFIAQRIIGNAMRPQLTA